MFYIALGQFDLQYSGIQQHFKLFQEIWSALHDSVLSCGGSNLRFLAVENNLEGDFQVDGEMKEIYSCELSI